MQRIYGQTLALSIVVVTWIGLVVTNTVGFHYFRRVPNNPLQNPVQVVNVAQDHVELADGRKVQMDPASLKELAIALRNSDSWVEIDPLAAGGDDVVVYTKFPHFICGLGSPMFTIPLVSVDVPQYNRAQATFGTIMPGRAPVNGGPRVVAAPTP